MIIDKIKEFKQIRFVQDVAILQVGSLVGTGLSVVSSIIFARVLGPSSYGTYSLVFAFVGLVGLLMDWGAGYGALTLLAEANAKQDRQEFKKIVVYFFKVSLYSTVAVGLVIMVLAPLITRLAYQEPHIGYLARWVILASMVRVFYSLLIILLQVLRKMKYLTFLENINKSCYTVIPAVLVLLGLGVFGIVLGHFIAAILFLIFSVTVYAVFSRKYSALPSLSEIQKSFFNVKIKKYFIFGFTVAFDKNLSALYTLLPLVIAGAFITTQDIAFFKIAVGLVGMSAVFLGPISRLLNVQLPQSKVQSLVSLKEAFFKSSFGSFVISLGLAMGVILLARPLITIFYGQEFSPSVQFVYILVINLLISGWSVGLGPLYRTLNKMKLTIILNIVLIVFGLPFFYYLIKSMGVWGLTIAHVAWQGTANIFALIIISNILNKQIKSVANTQH